MADFDLKANDRLPSIQAPLAFKDPVGVPDLTQAGTTVKFVMKQVLSVSAAGVPLFATTPKVNSSAVIVNPVTATVRYDWTATDTNLPGDFVGEFQVTYPDGRPQTFPTDTWIEIRITADLDGGV